MEPRRDRELHLEAGRKEREIGSESWLREDRVGWVCGLGGRNKIETDPVGYMDGNRSMVVGREGRKGQRDKD